MSAIGRLTGRPPATVPWRLARLLSGPRKVLSDGCARSLRSPALRGGPRLRGPRRNGRGRVGRGRAGGRSPAGGTFAWLGHPLPVPAWIILLGGLAAGGAPRRDDDRRGVPGRPRIEGPPSSPGPTPTAVATDEPDVLVTARAHALPPAATCPSGSDPGAPGRKDQAWPPSGTAGADSLAFDRQSGRIVASRHLLHERRSPDVDLRRLCQHVVTHGPGAEPAPAGSRGRRRFRSDDRVRAWRRVCLRARRDVELRPRRGSVGAWLGRAGPDDRLRGFDNALVIPEGRIPRSLGSRRGVRRNPHLGVRRRDRSLVRHPPAGKPWDAASMYATSFSYDPKGPRSSRTPT